MAYDGGMPRPLILFGAFDRHNFGDLLFPHIATALLPQRELIFAGLAARDLRPYGGHAVRALHEVRASLGAQPVDLLHVGGEILTCSAWQAAVMLLPAQEAPATIAYLQARPQERDAWVRRTLGSETQAPYVAGRQGWPALRRLAHGSVGGVALPACAPPLRTEVLDQLRSADFVSVREQTTLGHLQAAGLAARLLPDAAVMVAELFGERLQQHAAQGEVARLRARLPQGYLAVQCSAEFGDDATLTLLAQQLAQVVRDTGLGLALFRAGAAPWHDSLLVLQRLAAQLAPGSCAVFESLQLWDICALIAASRGYAGSSLHGRIVATACALPYVSLRAPVAGTQQGKAAAWAASWEGADGVDTVVEVAALATGWQRAQARPTAARAQLAQTLVQQYRQGFAALRAALD